MKGDEDGLFGKCKRVIVRGLQGVVSGDYD